VSEPSKSLTLEIDSGIILKGPLVRNGPCIYLTMKVAWL
jgi:hypothetical protein